MRRRWKRFLAGLLTAVLLLTTLPVQALAAEHPFRDVGRLSWYADAVEYVYSHGLFQGTTDTTFTPEGTMTRAMLVTVLGRIAEVDAADYGGGTAFTDVSPDAYYAPYVAWAAGAGITAGVGDGRFCPNLPVTRAQIAVFFYRYLNWSGAPMPKDATDTRPADEAELPAYAREAVMALWRAGLFQGDPSGRFLPDENATRAQVAALCMRLDTHLVDSGIKTYIEEEDSKKPEKPSGGSTGGSGSGSHDDPDEPDDPAGEPMELYYEPEAEHTPLTAAAEGVAEDFSLTVICTDEERHMTAAEVEKRISAEDQNDLTGGQVIQVTAGAGDGEFIVTGMYIGLDGETPVQGFRPGGAYRIVLEDDALAFAGCEPSVREYHFTVAREEKDGLELNPNMIYLPAESISQITENGQAVAQINTALLTMTVGDEPVQEEAEMISGSFVSEKELNIGDTVAVYQGLHPDKRTVDAEGADKTADIAYVNITGRTGNKYDYESAQVEDVVFIPDMLPVSIYEDTDGNPDNHSITVPVDSMTYAEPVYAQLGLNGEVTVEEGDYLFFYEGVLEEAMATARSDEENGENGENGEAGEAGEQIVDHGYGKITSLTLDKESGSYVIEYEPTTREEIAEELSAYDEEPINTAEMLSQEDLQNLERSIAQEAVDSGFAQDAANRIVAMALRGESLEAIQRASGAGSVRVSSVQPAAQVPMPLAAPAGEGGGATGGPQAEIKNIIPFATVDTTLQHFQGQGIRVDLMLSFDLYITGGAVPLIIHFDTHFIQEVQLSVNVGGKAIWDNFIYLVWWIDDYQINADLKISAFTDIDIDVTAKSNDGVTEVPDIIDAIKGMLDKGGENDKENDDSLVGRYKEMLENDGEWVDIFSKNIFKDKVKVLKIITLHISLDFVISGKVNLYLGLDFWYENQRQYNFTLMLFSGRSSNNTIDLSPEQYELDVYVMGTLSLKAGLRLTLEASLISKKVASAGLVTEFGAYLDLYGYFHYYLKYHQEEGRESEASGALYVELGLYLQVGAELSALGGLVQWNPTLAEDKWPLWSAGNEWAVMGFATALDGKEAEISLKHNSSLYIPSKYLTIREFSMKTGEVRDQVYGADNFNVALTDDDNGFFQCYRAQETFWDNTHFFPMLSFRMTLQLATKGAENSVEPVREGRLTLSWKPRALAFSTKPISLEVKLHWDRLREGGYYLEFRADNASGYDMIKQYLPYGAQLPDPGTPKRQGMEFLGWCEGFPPEADRIVDPWASTMPERDLFYFAVWAPALVPYADEHYIKDPEGNLTLYKTVPREGYCDAVAEMTNAIDIPGYHFTGWVEWTRIAPDGSTTVGYRYNPNEHKVTYQLDEDTVLATFYVKYDRPIPTVEYGQAPVYTYSGWETDAALETNGEGKFLMPDQDVVFTPGAYIPNQDTPYTVEHYAQTPEGRYVLRETERRTGTTDTVARVELKSYEDCDPGQYTPAIIKGDGSTVIKVLYAQTKKLHTVTFLSEGKAIYRRTLREGTSLADVFPSPTRVGYTLEGWADESGATVTPETLAMPDGDVTYTAQWAASGDVRYQVSHQEQQADGAYQQVKLETRYGVTGQPAAVTPMTHDPAEYQPGTYDPNIPIAADGSTVVAVTYDRATYTVTYDLNGQGASFTDPAAASQTLRWGQGLLDGTGVSRPGHRFNGWNTAADGSGETVAEMPKKTVTLYAQWTAQGETGISYTVEHYGTGESDPGDWDRFLIKREVLTAPPGVTEVTIQPLDSPYYTVDGSIDGNSAGETIQLNPSGTTVAVCDYLVKEYTLTMEYEDPGYGHTYKIKALVPYGAPMREFVLAGASVTLIDKQVDGVSTWESYGPKFFGRTHSTLTGLYSDAAHTVPYTGDTMPDKELTLYPAWKGEEYEIELYADSEYWQVEPGVFEGRSDIVPAFQAAVAAVGGTFRQNASNGKMYITLNWDTYMAIPEIPGLDYITDEALYAGLAHCGESIHELGKPCGMGGYDFVWKTGGDGLSPDSPMEIHASSQWILLILSPVIIFQMEQRMVSRGILSCAPIWRTPFPIRTSTRSIMILNPQTSPLCWTAAAAPSPV